MKLALKKIGDRIRETWQRTLAKARPYVRRHLAACMAAAVLLGAIGYSWGKEIRLPSTILGIPSVLWAPGGTVVNLPHGGTMQYLTGAQSRRAFHLIVEPGCILWTTDRSGYAYDYSIWEDTQEAPYSLCRGTVLGARDMVIRTPEEKEVNGRTETVWKEENWSILYFFVEKVVFDVSPVRMHAGEIITIAWGEHHRNGGGMRRHMAFYPGNRYYLRLQDSHTAFEKEGSDAYFTPDSVHMIETHAQYLLRETDYAVWDYWPIEDGKVYAPRKTVDLSYDTRKIQTLPVAIYDEFEFDRAVSERFRELYALWFGIPWEG